MLWTVSTFTMKAYIAASCRCVVLSGSFDIAGRIDPRVSFSRLAPTENLFHFHTATSSSRVLMTLVSFSGMHAGATHVF